MFNSLSIFKKRLYTKLTTHSTIRRKSCSNLGEWLRGSRFRLLYFQLLSDQNFIILVKFAERNMSHHNFLQVLRVPEQNGSNSFGPALRYRLSKRSLVILRFSANYWAAFLGR